MGKQKRVNKKIVKSLKKSTSAGNVFKVAGAKSLKPQSKGKAKVLKVELKKLQTETTSKVAAADDQLKKIQKEVILPKLRSPKKRAAKKDKKEKVKDNSKLTQVVTVAIDTMKM